MRMVAIMKKDMNLNDDKLPEKDESRLIAPSADSDKPDASIRNEDPDSEKVYPNFREPDKQYKEQPEYIERKGFEKDEENQ